MAEKIDEETRKILEKYKQKLSNEIQLEGTSSSINNYSNNNNNNNNNNNDAFSSNYSSQYKTFRNEMHTKGTSFYENACNFCEKLVKIAPDKKNYDKLVQAISTSHLNITPTGAATFAILMPIFIILIGMILVFLIALIFQKDPPIFFIGFSVFVGLAFMIPLQNIPYFIANSWRLSASGDMILGVFYIVTFMRHTSNLELGIVFSADHITGPLSLDLRKVLWDIETGKFSSVRESLDNYLQVWREYNPEFVESMHLIEASLYEGSNDNRLKMLDKALDVILSETFEKMMHYAHNLKSPLTSLNMLGFVLPILGLVLLPLVVSFIQGAEWYYIFIFYAIVLPGIVYYLGKNILASRPTGYGDTDITKSNPSVRKYRKDPKFFAISLFIILFLIGLIPIILSVIGFKNIPIGEGNYLGPEECSEGQYCLLEFLPKLDSNNEEIKDRQGNLVLTGPFDLFSSIFSVFIPLAFGLSVGLYYKIRSSKIIKIRDESKKLEREFSSGLFQLGNRLGDGFPAEVAFGKVATVMKGTVSGKFFSEVSMKITNLGYGVKEALFSKEHGVVYNYPSSVIEGSMKVLVEAIRKSPKIASQAIISISNYMKEIHRIDERLEDLLSDVISSMKSLNSFLAPIISAIVIGIASMITNVLGKISFALATQGAEVEGMAGMDGFFGIGIPTYFFQISVGLYVVAVIYILTIILSGVENGSDKLKEEYLIGKNLVNGTLLYCMLALTCIVTFNLIANLVVGNVLATG
ncbi:MAG: hypothetical protein ACLFPJ_02080 [Candidatus Woesearchaeota archaeon]